MSKRQALLEQVGGLSTPSKMPWYGWSIPASRCKTGSKLAKVPGTVCHGCYALKGRYGFEAVQDALERRLKAYESDPKAWEDNMVELLTMLAENTPKNLRFFRWFDSGDLQSVTMLKHIVNIAKRLPAIRFWLPTREYAFVREFTASFEVPKNLNIRVSTHKIDGEPVNIPGSTSSVVVTKDKFTCPAPKQGNQCVDCRKCWNQQVPVVTYHLH